MLLPLALTRATYCFVCVHFLQPELKDEAEKPNESAEKSDKTEAAEKVKKEGAEKVKKEGAEVLEREEENEEGGEAKTAASGTTAIREKIHKNVPHTYS